MQHIIPYGAVNAQRGRHLCLYMQHALHLCANTVRQSCVSHVSRGLASLIRGGIPVTGIILHQLMTDPVIMTAPSVCNCVLKGMPEGSELVCEMCSTAAAGYMTPIAKTPKLMGSSMHVRTCTRQSPLVGWT